MRKIFVLFIVSILCVCQLTACSKSKILIVDYSKGDGVEFDLKREYDLNYEFKKDSSAKENYEIEINGEKVTGNYVETLFSSFYDGNTDVYEATMANGYRVKFRINCKNDKLVYYMIIAGDSEIKYPLGELSYDDCLQIAEKYVKEHDKIGTYEQVFFDGYKKVYHDKVKGDIYSFQFVKKADDKKTVAQMNLKITTAGIITLANSTEQFTLDEKDIEWLKSYKFDPEKMPKDVKEKIVGELKDKEDVILSVHDYSFAKLEDGHIYIIYDIEIKKSDDYDINRSVTLLKLVK